MTADIQAFTSCHTTKLKAQSGVKPLYSYAFRPDIRMTERPQDPLLVQKHETETDKSNGKPTSKSFMSFLLPSRRKQSISSSAKKNSTPLPSSSSSSSAIRKYNSLVTLMSTYPSAVAISENLRRDDLLSLFTAIRPHLLLSLRGQPQFNRWLTTLVRYTRECETCEITAKETTAIEKSREYRLNGWYRGSHTCVGCGDIICTSCATFFAHASDWRDRIAQTLGYHTVYMIRTDNRTGERYIPSKEYTDKQRRASCEDMFTYVRSFCKDCAKDPCAFKVGFGHEVRPNLVVKDLLKGRPSYVGDEERVGQSTSAGVNGGDGDEIRSIHSGSDQRGGKRELDHRTVMIEECNVIPYGFFKMSTTPCWMMQPGGTLIDAYSWGHGRVIIRSRHHDN